MSNAVSPSSQEQEKSSSSPSDYEVFDYEEVEGEFPYQRFACADGEDFQPDEDEEDLDGCGTPLNLELAQLLNQGIVSKTKASFGISKNYETLEKSTIELSQSEASPKRRPRDLTCYERSPDLYLRRGDDDDNDDFFNNENDDDEVVDFVNVRKLRAHRNGFEPAATSSKLPEETVFENGSTDQSPCVGGGTFRFTEPTTSFHSAYGYDNERIMFEGTL